MENLKFLFIFLSVFSTTISAHSEQMISKKTGIPLVFINSMGIDFSSFSILLISAIKNHYQMAVILIAGKRSVTL